MDPTDPVENPDAVGRPEAGTRVRLDLTVPGADPSTGLGELVVTGPGVMTGCALHPDDLACGPMLEELRTGDLARVDERGQPAEPETVPADRRLRARVIRTSPPQAGEVVRVSVAGPVRVVPRPHGGMAR